MSEKLRELLEALEPLLDNADGYDVSNVRRLIRDSEHWTDEYRDELLAAEERARLAWKALRAAQSAHGSTTEPEIVAVVDGRCGCDKCAARTGDMYRMVGTCYNCGAKPILMLFRAGDPASSLDCPVCGKWHGVHSQRLATADEIPASASHGSAPELEVCGNWTPLKAGLPGPTIADHFGHGWITGRQSTALGSAPEATATEPDYKTLYLKLVAYLNEWPDVSAYHALPSPPQIAPTENP